MTSSRIFIAAARAVAMTCLLLLSAGVRPSVGQQFTTIRVSGPPLDAFKAAYYANTSGIFRKYGLTVDITIASSGNAAMAALSGGSVDIAFTNLLPVMQAYLRGIHFVVVAPAGWYLSEKPQVALVVKIDSPLRTGHDLNGKTIASSAVKDLNAVTTMAWMDQNGGDSRTLRVIELPSSAIFAALQEGRIDAAPLATPFMDQALASGTMRVLAKPYDTIGKRFEIAGYVGTADFVDRNADTMGRFAQAMHESILYTNVHMAETAALVASYSGVEASTVAKAVRATDPEYVEARYIQPIIDIASKYGLLERRFEAEEIISSVAVKPRR